MIKLSNITKIFKLKDKEVTALNNVTLHVDKGDICGVIGSSGAGKSTLIRCANLLERPTGGQVVIDGQELMQMDAKELVNARRNIGMIFQHFNLLNARTVFGNVALPLELLGKSKREIKEKVGSLLALVELSDKVNNYPSSLSGGQKQRVAIARALACDPKILLCDEATSALDPATTHSILDLLREINTKLGLTILLITHEMEVVKQICHQVAVIDHGELIEQGTVSEIFSTPKTELAQQFIHSAFRLNLPKEYVAKLSEQQLPGTHPVIKFEFTGRSVNAPLLSLISKKFDVDLSILASQIDYAGDIKFGFVVAEMSGENDDLVKAKSYLIDHNVRVEVLGYV